MTEKDFVRLKGQGWRDFSSLLSRSGSKRFESALHAIRFPIAYREICRDLNHAKAERYSLTLIESLNRLVWEGHHILYRGRSDLPRRSLVLMAADFPRAVRRYALGLVLCHLLFYGAAGAAFLYSAGGEGRAQALLGLETAESLLDMYNPSSEHLLKPRGVESDADMFGFYINNNISIGFRTFGSGILGGIGSLFSLVYNAVFMGSAIALIMDAGFAHMFFPFILGHSSFELTAIVIFSLAGFLLGKAMLMPGRKSRAESLRICGKDVMPLVVGATLFLFLAACIEAFWSARVMESWIKYLVAALLWAAVYLFFIFGGHRARR